MPNSRRASPTRSPKSYLSLQQSAKTDQTRAASNWLAVEIEKMRTKVASAEAKVEQYRSQSNLFVGSNNSSLPNQQLTEINSQIAAARGQKSDLEARAKQLRELVRSGQPINSSDIANSESMRRLTEQGNALRSQLAEQSTTLMDQHPRIKELRAQIAEIERAKRTEGERLARQLDNDAKVAGDRLAAVTASLDQVKKLASQTNEQDVQLRSLERDAKSQRDLLESYLVKYSEASARDNVNAAPPEARIISRATPAAKPAYPKKMSTVLIAAFAAFALSAGFIVTGALLAQPVAPANYSYAQANYAAPVFAPPRMPPPLPHMASPPLAPAMPAMAMAMAPVPVSSIEQIAQRLRQSGEAGRRVTFVGSARNAGTTYAAITLARALAGDTNVVLVDLAFGAPNLSVISTDPNAAGIAELVRGTAGFGDIITRDQFSQVHLVATGNVGADGPALAASPMLQTVIDALAQSYDHVVIDAGSAADAPVERFAPSGALRRIGRRQSGCSGDAGGARAHDHVGLCRCDFGCRRGADRGGLNCPLLLVGQTCLEAARRQHHAPQFRVLLDRTLGGGGGAQHEGDARTLAVERPITIEHRLGVRAEQILVFRFADAEVERMQAALAAMPHHMDEQLLAGTLGAVEAVRDGDEHRRETAIGNHAADRRNNHAGNGEGVELDKPSAGRRRLRRGADEFAHARFAEYIRQTDGAGAGGLLFEEIVEHGADLGRSFGPRKAHLAMAGEQAFLAAQFLAGARAGIGLEQSVKVARQRAAIAKTRRGLMRQHRKRIVDVIPRQRLVRQHHEVGLRGQALQHGAQPLSADQFARRRGATAPC